MIRVLWAALGAALIALSVALSTPGAAEPAALSPGDAAAVERVAEYLNRISTLRARFVQVSSNGAYAVGEVLLSRPGRMRFDYDPPHPALVIANGLSLLFYDRELKQASFLPLWETPLWFLIGEEVKLGGSVRVAVVKGEFETLRVTLEDTDRPDAGTVTLVFADRPLSLKKWEIVDPLGVVTEVTLINPEYGVAIDSDAFDFQDLEIENAVGKRDN